MLLGLHFGSLDNSGNDTASLLIALAVLPRVHVIKYSPGARTHLLVCLLLRDFIFFPTSHGTNELVHSRQSTGKLENHCKDIKFPLICSSNIIHVQMGS